MRHGVYVWGMHWLGWVFWILLLALVVMVVIRLIAERKPRQNSPAEILRRRFESGEISSSEFNERRAGLKS